MKKWWTKINGNLKCSCCSFQKTKAKKKEQWKRDKHKKQKENKKERQEGRKKDKSNRETEKEKQKKGEVKKGWERKEKRNTENKQQMPFLGGKTGFFLLKAKKAKDQKKTKTKT